MDINQAGLDSKGALLLALCNLELPLKAENNSKYFTKGKNKLMKRIFYGLIFNIDE